MTSQLLEKARKQLANKPRCELHEYSQPIQDDCLQFSAEFAASCLENSVAIHAAEKAILVLEIERHTATKALLTAREQEIERLKRELASENKVAQLEIARAESAERELAELRGKK